MLPLCGCDLVFGAMLYAPRLNPVPHIHYNNALARAEKGDPEAQLEVAETLSESCHRPHCAFAGTGWRPTCDEATALKWYSKSAESGNAKAQYALGWMYSPHNFQSFIPEKERNVAEMVAWLKKSADQKYAPAAMSLGELYSKGEEVPEDNAAAATWYLVAAEQEDANAQIKIAKMYQSGHGVPKDMKKGIGWGLRSAQSGSHQAEVAALYLEKSPPDYAQAYYWAVFAGRGEISGNTAKLNVDWEQHLTLEQMAEIQKRVERDLARHCRMKTMPGTCKER